MVKVATIINTHGLKGECKCYLHTDDASNRFAKGKHLYLEDGQMLVVQSFRMQKGFGYVKFEEIQSIDEAEKYKQKILWIKESELPELEEGHYYYFELMDCEVYNQEKEYLGKVLDILETGANLVLRIGDEKENFYVPLYQALLKRLMLHQKRLS